MGRKTVSNELEEVGRLIKKLFFTPYPECVGDTHKKALKDAIELRQELYRKKMEEKHDSRTTGEETN